jgi:hypothetical protein
MQGWHQEMSKHEKHSNWEKEEAKILRVRQT